VETENLSQVIIQKLSEIETAVNVRVLYAVESGSRAWGFASPDSDYDVRFIYLRKLPDYLRLDVGSDVIEYKPDEVWDINGWDLKKALQLAHKSNPTLLEWLGSPIVYKTTPEFENIRPEMLSCYRKKHALYHYLSMSKKNYRSNFNDVKPKLKHYFYVIRPILACRWIQSKDTPPPVLFSELVNHCLEPTLIGELNALIARKTVSSEGEREARMVVWDAWIEQNLANIENHMNELPRDGWITWEGLNEAFCTILSR
jgi:predicted nucleotidyltransferase